MRSAANPARAVSPARSFLALLCLILTTLIAIPCHASIPTHRHVSMQASHCSVCCTPSLISATKLCCESSPQPAAPSNTHSPCDFTLSTEPIGIPGDPQTISIAAMAIPARPAPSPPLHPILRI